MKYVALIVLFVTCSGHEGYTQSKARTYLGVNGGVNFGTVDLFHSFNGYDFNGGFLVGGQGGIVVMNFLRNHIGVQTGMQFVQKGWTQKFGQDLPDYQINLDYLELPFLVNIHTGKRSLHFYANAGCFFEYLVNSRQDADPEETGGWDFHAFDQNRDPKHGYGFKAGGGVFYDFRFGTLMLEGTGSYSLSNVMDPIRLHTGIPNLSNKINVGFTLGYLISFGSFEDLKKE